MWAYKTIIMDRIIESKGGNDYDRRASSHDQRAREPKAGPRAVGIAGVGGIVVTKKSTCVTSGTHGYSKHMKDLAHKSKSFSL